MLAQEGDAHSSGQGRMGGSRRFRRKEEVGLASRKGGRGEDRIPGFVPEQLVRLQAFCYHTNTHSKSTCEDKRFVLAHSLGRFSPSLLGPILWSLWRRLVNSRNTNLSWRICSGAKYECP